VLAGLLLKEAAALRLADMENPAQGFAVELRMLGGETSFGVGESINFQVESGRDGYLSLVDLGTDGTVTVLIPNADFPSPRLRAGASLTYPTERDLYFIAQPPVGSGLVRAFVTERPLEVSIPPGEVAAQGGRELAERLGIALAAAAGDLEGAVRLDTWGTASIVYEIHD
jgi:hypothetical protein